jgi:hypothetical protein
MVICDTPRYASAVRQDMVRTHDTRVVNGDVHEYLVEFHVLLRMGVNQVVILQARDGQNRLAVKLRVVQTVQQMQPARSGCCEANAELACVFRISACHEGGALFVADLNESNLVGSLAERFHDSVDAVARHAEHDVDAPIVNRIDQNVRCCSFHLRIPPLLLDLEHN